FEMEPLHEHCEIPDASGELENLLARAAGDHLGAYATNLRDATTKEKQEIGELFSQAGPYLAYQVQPGNVSGCRKCGHNSHAFSSWYFGVAWDWCLLATWPKRNLLWMGCLTDTD